VERAVKAAPQDAALRRIQAKLERWELLHLREHARALAERLEAAEERAERAEQSAEYWREQVMQIQEQLADDLALGITPDGQIGLVYPGTGNAA
jgi:hypothetical protein